MTVSSIHGRRARFTDRLRPGVKSALPRKTLTETRRAGVRIAIEPAGTFNPQRGPL